MKFSRILVRLLGAKLCIILMIFPVLYYFLFKREKRNGIRNLYFRLYGKDGCQKWKFHMCAFRNFWYFACSIVDKISYKTSKIIFSQEHDPSLFKLGCVYIGAHYGDWFISPFYLNKNTNCKIGVLLDPTISPDLNNILDSLSTNSFRFISTKRENPTHLALEAKEILEDNGCLCLMGDRLMSGSPSVNVSFLGESAPFPLLPFRFVKFFNKPVYFFSSKRSNAFFNNSYIISNSMIWDGVEPVSENDLVVRYVRALEAEVRNSPQHFFNFYDFWRTNEKDTDRSRQRTQH